MRAAGRATAWSILGPGGSIFEAGACGSRASARGGHPPPAVRRRRLRRLLLVAAPREQRRPHVPPRRRPAAAQLAPPPDRLPRPRRHRGAERHADRAAHGQRGPGDFGPTQRLDVELELGFVIGHAERRPRPGRRARSTTSSASCCSTTGARATSRPGSTARSAPSSAKSFATSISHWVTPLAELPRTAREPQDPPPLPYLREEPWAFDIPLELELNGTDDRPHQRRPALLERRPADRAPDVQRRHPARRRPARLRHDLRPRAATSAAACSS